MIGDGISGWAGFTPSLRPEASHQGERRRVCQMGNKQRRHGLRERDAGWLAIVESIVACMMTCS
jgi:hypothetical protein